VLGRGFGSPLAKAQEPADEPHAEVVEHIEWPVEVVCAVAQPA
jgi:hypothetical protein